MPPDAQFLAVGSQRGHFRPGQVDHRLLPVRDVITLQRSFGEDHQVGSRETDQRPVHPGAQGLDILPHLAHIGGADRAHLHDHHREGTVNSMSASKSHEAIDPCSAA